MSFWILDIIDIINEKKEQIKKHVKIQLLKLMTFLSMTASPNVESTLNMFAL